MCAQNIASEPPQATPLYQTPFGLACPGRARDGIDIRKAPFCQQGHRATGQRCSFGHFLGQCHCADTDPPPHPPCAPQSSVWCAAPGTLGQVHEGSNVSKGPSAKLLQLFKLLIHLHPCVSRSQSPFWGPGRKAPAPKLQTSIWLRPRAKTKKHISSSEVDSLSKPTGKMKKQNNLFSANGSKHPKPNRRASTIRSKERPKSMQKLLRLLAATKASRAIRSLARAPPSTKPQAPSTKQSQAFARV